MLILSGRNGEEREKRSFLFPLFTLFYYLLLFFTMFYLRIGNSADRIILVEGCGKEREDTLFFSIVSFRTETYSCVQGAGVTGCKGRKRKRAKREDCEKAAFSFCSGKEKRKKEKH